MNNYNDTDTFFWDHQKQERVRVTYRVCLAMPATFEGYVDVEAQSEEEAARLALDERFEEIVWCDLERDDDSDAEVIDVYCEEPPDNAILIGKNPHAGNLDALLEPGDLPTATLEQNQAKPDGGGGQCR